MYQSASATMILFRPIPVKISQVNYGTRKYNRYRYTLASLTSNILDIRKDPYPESSETLRK